METARAAALGIRRSYALTGSPGWDDLLAIAADLGAVVVPGVPFAGHVREVYVQGHIGLQKGLDASWRRWLVAHALGHHMLHPDANHLYLAAAGQRYWIDRHENDAEIFAGFLLFGALDRVPVGVQDVMDLALAADLPLTCTLRWTRLIAYEPSPRASLDRYDVEFDAPIGPVIGEYRVPGALLRGC